MKGRRGLDMQMISILACLDDTGRKSYMKRIDNNKKKCVVGFSFRNRFVKLEFAQNKNKKRTSKLLEFYTGRIAAYRV